MPLNSFSALSLTEPLLRALERERFVEPTPIQARAIPHLLAGRNLLGIAQTGTGKTAAFALPMLQHLISTPARAAHFATRALILAPTHELALQIEDSLRRLAGQPALRIVAVLGGVSRFMQVQRMRGGADIVVGTPGRVCDLMATGHRSRSIRSQTRCMMHWHAHQADGIEGQYRLGSQPVVDPPMLPTLEEIRRYAREQLAQTPSLEDSPFASGTTSGAGVCPSQRGRIVAIEPAGGVTR